MLLEINDELTFENFTQLREHTLEMIEEARNHEENRDKQTTIIFGPITGNSKDETDRNFRHLVHHSYNLAFSKKWTTLATHTLLNHAGILVTKLGITGYPHIILDELTLPLIRSGCFDAIHFRNRFRESIGATREHNTACEAGIRRIYVP